MSFKVYILCCADGSYYTGHTEDLERRLQEHTNGVGGYTASRLPTALVFSQDFASRDEALASERRIKGWSRAKKEAMIRADWAEVSRLARSRNINVSPSASLSPEHLGNQLASQNSAGLPAGKPHQPIPYE